MPHSFIARLRPERLRRRLPFSKYLVNLFRQVIGPPSFSLLSQSCYSQERASKKGHLDRFLANHCHHAILYEQVST